MVLREKRNKIMAKLTWRIWLLIIILLLSILSISPSFKSGVVIKSVEKNSTAPSQGLQAGEIIKTINNFISSK